MCPSSFLLHLYNFSAPFSHFCPLLSRFSAYPRLFGVFFPTCSLFPMRSPLPFQHLRTGATRPLLLRNPTRFDRLYLRQCRGGGGAYTNTDTYTLSFSILLVRTLLPETLASLGNYLAPSLDSSSNSTACSLDSHCKYLTRHPDHFIPKNCFWKHFININCFASENSLYLQYFSTYFKHIFLHSAFTSELYSGLQQGLARKDFIYISHLNAFPPG